MSSRSLWDNLFRRRDEREIVTTTLARVPVFKSLTRSELTLVKQMVHLRRYEAGEVVFTEGQPGTGMYVIVSGHVNVILNHRRADEIVLARLADGDFFGEMSLLDEGPRSALATTIEATELAGFFRSDLLDLIDKNARTGNKILLALAEVLGTRLRATNSELRRLREQLGDEGAPAADPAGRLALRA
jgi:CRP/FNR family transcriptional regulator